MLHHHYCRAPPPPVAPASAQKVAPQVQVAPAAQRAPPPPQQPPPKPSNYAQAAAGETLIYIFMTLQRTHVSFCRVEAPRVTTIMWGGMHPAFQQASARVGVQSAKYHGNGGLPLACETAEGITVLTCCPQPLQAGGVLVAVVRSVLPLGVDPAAAVTLRTRSAVPLPTAGAAPLRMAGAGPRMRRLHPLLARARRPARQQL